MPPTKLNGYSFATLLRDPPSAWNNERLIEYLGVSGGNGIVQKRFRAIHTQQYVYVEYDNGDREFYDLVSDPLQLTNVVSDPAMAALADRFRKLLYWTRDL